MRRHLTSAVLATALSALFLSLPSTSAAHPFLYHRDSRRDFRDIQRDRRDLHRDWQDVRNDRADLRRDWQDIRRDRWDLHEDWHDRRWDLQQ